MGEYGRRSSSQSSRLLRKADISRMSTLASASRGASGVVTSVSVLSSSIVTLSFFLTTFNTHCTDHNYTENMSFLPKKLISA